jgi:hypothetical protein
MCVDLDSFALMRHLFSQCSNWSRCSWRCWVAVMGSMCDAKIAVSSPDIHCQISASRTGLSDGSALGVIHFLASAIFRSDPPWPLPLCLCAWRGLRSWRSNRTDYKQRLRNWTALFAQCLANTVAHRLMSALCRDANGAYTDREGSGEAGEETWRVALRGGVRFIFLWLLFYYREPELRSQYSN